MGKLIYVVEDDEDIRFIVEYVLRESDYEVEVFGTLTAYEAQPKDKTPDLVVIDVMLPDGNGLDLCKSIRANPALQHTNVVIMSAHASPAYVLEQACADDFISKPFDLDYFLSRIKKVLHDAV
ncbi:putative two-component response regulator phoP [Pedobacter sp. BAL39]|uniref:response regulator transcription factor n=1 Tax=Pedobacter sp. BAL39 TaxID=391596 RepID=UPI00015598B9|nr:response regulator [Pedobacter sp. BAL39]EDM38297.1 putative two-component response regulator phoP [Pedobacter sp. BAL39]